MSRAKSRRREAKAGAVPAGRPRASAAVDSRIHAAAAVFRGAFQATVASAGPQRAILSPASGAFVTARFTAPILAAAGVGGAGGAPAIKAAMRAFLSAGGATRGAAQRATGRRRAGAFRRRASKRDIEARRTALISDGGRAVGLLPTMGPTSLPTTITGTHPESALATHTRAPYGADQYPIALPMPTRFSGAETTLLPRRSRRARFKGHPHESAKGARPSPGPPARGVFMLRRLTQEGPPPRRPAPQAQGSRAGCGACSKGAGRLVGPSRPRGPSLLFSSPGQRPGAARAFRLALAIATSAAVDGSRLCPDHNTSR